MKAAQFGVMPRLPANWFVMALAQKTHKDAWIWECECHALQENLKVVEIGNTPEKALEACRTRIEYHEFNRKWLNAANMASAVIKNRLMRIK